jgi:amidase
MTGTPSVVDQLAEGTFASAAAMASAVAARAVSAEELVAAHLAEIERSNPTLNAFVLVDEEGALAAAKEMDARLARGERAGPLAGVPLSVKDSVDVRGLRSSHGRISDSYVAADDAPAVRRLRDAGCIILGKTNVPVYLSGHESANLDFGRTVNPWDHERASGGSSGGAAASVAAGLAAADLGSDLAGSLRLPAAWCGLAGHRPSNGIVSKLGNLPWPRGGRLEPHVSAIGPLTRTAADADLLFRSMLGVEGPESVGWKLDLPPSRIDSLRGARIGVWLDDPACPVDEETRAAIVAFAAALAAEGADVRPFTDAPVAGAEDLELFRRLQAGEVVHGFDEELWASHLRIAADIDDTDATRFSRAVTQTLRSALDDLERQRAAMQRWRDAFRSWDVVIAPAVSRAATRYGEHPEGTVGIDGIDHPAEVLSAWSRMSSIGKLPASVVAIGAGAQTGLPIGVQILGPYLEDHTPLRVAMLAERAGIAGFRTPPRC